MDPWTIASAVCGATAGVSIFWAGAKCGYRRGNFDGRLNREGEAVDRGLGGYNPFHGEFYWYAVKASPPPKEAP